MTGIFLGAPARATFWAEPNVDGPMAPGARSQPNKLARTAMFVLTRSRCSQSAGKVPTCEAACQRRWACTSRGYLLCHQRPGPDRRPGPTTEWRARTAMRGRCMACGIVRRKARWMSKSTSSDATKLLRLGLSAGAALQANTVYPPERALERPWQARDGRMVSRVHCRTSALWRCS